MPRATCADSNLHACARVWAADAKAAATAGAAAVDVLNEVVACLDATALRGKVVPVGGLRRVRHVRRVVAPAVRVGLAVGTLVHERAGATEPRLPGEVLEVAWQVRRVRPSGAWADALAIVAATLALTRVEAEVRAGAASGCVALGRVEVAAGTLAPLHRLRIRGVDRVAHAEILQGQEREGGDLGAAGGGHHLVLVQPPLEVRPGRPGRPLVLDLHARQRRAPRVAARLGQQRRHGAVELRHRLAALRRGGRAAAGAKETAADAKSVKNLVDSGVDETFQLRRGFIREVLRVKVRAADDRAPGAAVRLARARKRQR
mmetsp:Transcript_22811/g.70715  ORF Transcript_22811/g.70715 Transcript_22811/m.70715 type:complete len:317 (+) Transcript_22811:888-1838(+)